MPTDALAKSEQDALAVAPAVVAMQTTVAKLETVRKFIQKNLNAGQRRLLKKIGKRAPTEDEAKQLKELEIDFGTIPSVKKPFLKQPGAEKIALWLHVRPVYVTEVTPIPDHPGHIEVHGRCRLMAVGALPELEVFSGPLASCTTMESNYRYRWVKMEPPPAYDWAVKEGRIGKELGTHRSFKDKKDNKWVWQERHENPNVYDEHNKVRQVAEKRMLVKAVRNFAALSEIFTEDPSEWSFDDVPGTSAVPEEPATPGSVVRTPEPDSKLEKIVEIRWPADTADVAVIHLPDLPGCADLAAKMMDFCDWQDNLKAWICPAAHVPDVATLATQLGLQVVEIEQENKVAPPPVPPPKPVPPPQTAVPNVGIVSLVRKEAGVNKKSPYYVVMFAGRTLYCYRAHLFELLAKAKDQECEFVIEQGNYPKIVDVKRIGPTEYDEGLPVVQRG